MYFSRLEIVKRFEAFGYRFNHFELISEGRHAPEDAEFNYADIPHVKYVHKEFQTVPAMVEQDKLATLHLQKALGLTFPVAVICYHHNRTQQTAYFTFLFFMVLVTTEFEKTATNTTRVISRYSVGSVKWLFWLTGMVKWLITKNYYGLMKDDIPMRERRGELREWGYRFATDVKRYGYVESMDVLKQNLIPPSANSESANEINIDLKKSFLDSSDMLIGKNDHWGLRLIKVADEIRAYPRLCNHEGASMDQARCSGKKIQCPWHGKLFNPWATIQLARSEEQHFQGDYHAISYLPQAAKISIKFLANANPVVMCSAAAGVIGAEAYHQINTERVKI